MLRYSQKFLVNCTAPWGKKQQNKPRIKPYREKECIFFCHYSLCLLVNWSLWWLEIAVCDTIYLYSSEYFSLSIIHQKSHSKSFSASLKNGNKFFARQIISISCDTCGFFYVTTYLNLPVNEHVYIHEKKRQVCYVLCKFVS